MKQFLALIAAILLLALANPAEAKRHHHRHHHAVTDANGNLGSGVVVSHKTGAKAYVSASVSSKFQGYIDDLEAQGATIKFMGGIRKGKCWSGGMHPCGKAIDVCQLSRGRVDSSCHLPSRDAIAVIAARHGLFEGGQWCSSDYGHAQAGVSAGACGSTYASAKRRHHRHRLAMR